MIDILRADKEVKNKRRFYLSHLRFVLCTHVNVQQGHRKSRKRKRRRRKEEEREGRRDKGNSIIYSLAKRRLLVSRSVGV